MSRVRDTSSGATVSRRMLLADAFRKALDLLAQKAGARLRTIDELAQLDEESLLRIKPLRLRPSEPGSDEEIARPGSAAERLILETSDGQRSLDDMAEALARDSTDPAEVWRQEIRAAFLQLAKRGLVVPLGEVPDLPRAETPLNTDVPAPAPTPIDERR